MKSPAEIKALIDVAPVDPASTTPAAAKPAPAGPPKHTTVGRLRPELVDLLAMSDDTLVYFGDGQITFNRIVNRGPNDGPALMQIEFNEIYVVTPDPTGG
jgi:hypothetical protein